MRTRTGFGLIEQMITVLILAVLITLAVPVMSHWLGRHQLRMAQTDYLGALRHARGLAINEQGRILFCASRDGTRCNNGDDWTGGWLVGRADPDHSGQIIGEPLFTHAAYASRLLISGNGTHAYVHFGADGSTDAVTNQSLFLCLRDDPRQVQVIRIARLGRIRSDQLKGNDTFGCTAE